MKRAMPLLASILFLLLLNLVHALTIPTAYHPVIDERGFYSNMNDSMADHKNLSTPTPTKTTSATSTVKTIIIIESNGHTYHELGGNADQPTGTSNINDPNESNMQQQVSQDTAMLHRLITITTVVGGVGIALLVAGTIFYIRLRAKRKRMKVEMNLYHQNGSFTSYLSNITGVNRRKRRRQRPHQQENNNDSDDNNNNSNNDQNHDHNNNNDNNNNDNNQHLSTTNIIRTLDTSDLPVNPDFQESIEMNVIPSAPPEPVLLNVPVRNRRQISMISQQQSFIEPISQPSSSVTPLPSAPSAKELMMNQPSSSSSSPSSPSTNLYHRRNTSLSSSVNTNTTSPRLIVDNYDTSSTSNSNRHHANLLRSTSSTQQHQNNLLKPTTVNEDEISDRSPVTPDIPPPAYTPSAPPLFILPPSRRRRSADEVSLDRYRH